MSVLRVSMGSQILRLQGPCVIVEIGAVDAERSTPATLLVDTGASRSHISSDLVARLRLCPLEDFVPVTWPDREPEYVPQFACAITFPEPIGRLVHNFAAAHHLKAADYGVLLGRDILRDSRLVVDFVSGDWELSW